MTDEAKKEGKGYGKHIKNEPTIRKYSKSLI